MTRKKILDWIKYNPFSFILIYLGVALAISFIVVKTIDF
jgi:hypothetical protein